jgi:hypothetical protein
MWANFALFNFVNNSKLINLPDNSVKSLSSHNIKSLPDVPKQFLQWFVGFVDAEGCFSIYPNRNGTSVSFEFRINLHIDDIGVLKKIAKILDVGVVRINKDRNSAVFSVKKFNDIVRVILPIFQEFPLQTTKYLDFTCFSEAILIKLNSESFGTKKIVRISETDLIKIKNLRANMNSGRLTIDKEQLDNLTKRVYINVWWLLGFVEGEGTFGYKHLVPYFQIGQHKKNLFVLNAIESFLLKLTKESHNTLGNQTFNVHYALNKKTNVYSMTVVSIDTLYSNIVPYFQSMSFLTRKALDFHYWAISVKIHKFGYYYLPEGKKIALQISSGTNKYRYTTTNIANKIELPSEDSISKLLAQPAPFDIASGLSHFELARKFTISKGGRNGFTVHIYDRESKRGKELIGSPFSTYGAGHVALGLRAGSRVIGRYIDTGKAYKGRYIFSSIPISVNEI